MGRTAIQKTRIEELFRAFFTILSLIVLFLVPFARRRKSKRKLYKNLLIRFTHKTIYGLWELNELKISDVMLNDTYHPLRALFNLTSEIFGIYRVETRMVWYCNSVHINYRQNNNFHNQNKTNKHKSYFVCCFGRKIYSLMLKTIHGY